MSDSILESTKKILGIQPDYTVFDLDVITHINSSFSTLAQLGVGPPEGFYVVDASQTWDEFLADDPRFNNVRSYVYLRVRMLFDPPTTGYFMESVKEQIKELEWRLNVQREFITYPNPGEPVPVEVSVIDGGTP